MRDRGPHDSRRAADDPRPLVELVFLHALAQPAKDVVLGGMWVVLFDAESGLAVLAAGVVADGLKYDQVHGPASRAASPDLDWRIRHGDDLHIAR